MSRILTIAAIAATFATPAFAGIPLPEPVAGLGAIAAAGIAGAILIARRKR